MTDSLESEKLVIAQIKTRSKFWALLFQFTGIPAFARRAFRIEWIEIEEEIL